MFGYACRETEELMPAPILVAHKILRLMAEDRKSGAQPGFGPDAKSQVTLKYESGKPVGVDTVVVSTQHSEDVTTDQVREMVKPYIDRAFPEGWTVPDDKLIVNPTGRFVIGGPDGDAGLTGRKIIVDTYGGAAPHGGGAFSGKDPTKVDRSAAYAARYLAKNVVAAGLADKCQIQLAYAIGVPDPVAIYVDTLGTGRADEDKIAATLREMVRLTPRGIRTQLDLLKPIYARTAAYGHFGRAPDPEGGFAWEKTDLAEELARSFGATKAAE
jgi:S-adenosylmethionine synthetase